MSGALSELAASVWCGLAPRALHLLLLGGVALLVDGAARGRGWTLLRSVTWWLVVAAALVPAGLVPAAAGLPGAGAAIPVAGVLRGAAAPPAGVHWIALGWAAGALLAAVCAARAELRARRESLAGAQVVAPRWARALVADAARQTGLRRVPELRVRASVVGPAVIGLVRPRIVVPAELLGDRRALRCALLHEMAHVARGDAWQAALLTAVRIVWWFHPAIGWAGARLAELRELAADARAVRALDREDRATYRDGLLRAARSWIASPIPALGFITPRSALMVRLEALRRQPSPPGRWRRGTAIAAFCASAWACVPLPGPGPGPEPRDLAELRGCLQLRYAVLGAMAAADSN